MEGDKRSCLRRRELRDSGSVISERFDARGRRKIKVDYSEEVVGDVKNTPIKGGEDEAPESELPAKRRRLTKQVEESWTDQEDLVEGNGRGKGRKTGEGRKKPSKKSKSKKTKTSGAAQDENGQFEVEKIVKVKILRNGKKEFLIHWKGFSAEYDTWEPESNLECKDLVNEYFEEHKEVIDESAEEEDTNEDKTRTSESLRSRRSKAGNSTVDTESSDTEGTKTGRKTAKLKSGKSKRSGTRERNPRAMRSRQEPVGTDAGKGDDDESEGKEATDNSQNSSSAEVTGEPSVDAESDAEKDYEVDRILDVRELRDGTREFLIKWKGFTKKYNTWEPESNMNCSEKLEKFLKGLEENSTERELRVDRKKTNRFTLDDVRRGRKLSLRLGKMPRKSYSEMD